MNKEEYAMDNEQQPSDENISSGETIANAEQPETNNQQPASENMEVHHHSHAHGKKNWKTYVWEFLMLFLAVFCGFLAEYQLEHVIEHQRAGDFAKSLVRDLENDITALDIHQKKSGIYIIVVDSLLERSKKKLEGSNATAFSFYTRFTYWTEPVSWNRATFEQIKNSGGLRYFKNYSLLEKIMKYDALINQTEAEFNNHQTRGNMLLKIINEIIDPVYHHDLSAYRITALDTMSANTRANYFSAKIEPLENNRDKIRELLNMAIAQQRNLRFNIDIRLKPAKELARELVSDLKKEYHLKDE